MNTRRRRPLILAVGAPARRRPRCGCPGGSVAGRKGLFRGFSDEIGLTDRARPHDSQAGADVASRLASRCCPPAHGRSCHGERQPGPRPSADARHDKHTGYPGRNPALDVPFPRRGRVFPHAMRAPMLNQIEIHILDAEICNGYAPSHSRRVKTAGRVEVAST